MNRSWRMIGLAAAVSAMAACEGSSVKMSVSDSGVTAEASTAPDPAAVRAAIEAANAKGIEGFNAGNPDAMFANYADDITVMMSGMKAMVGKPAAEAGLKGMLQSMDMKNFKNTTTDVVVDGSLAVETGYFTYEAGPKGGKLTPDTAKYLTVWKKQADGSWKIIRDINNTDIAPKM